MRWVKPTAPRGLDAFDKAFWNHVGHSFKTMFRAWGRSWSGGLFAPAPDAGEATQFYRQLSRYSSAFALCADMALLTLGGALKRKEMLSARFGDILSELYLLSAALKRWQDEGRQQADFAALEWCMASGFRTIENRFAEILANLPNRFVAVILKFLIQPFGARVTGPSDRVVHQCAQLVLEPSAARDRLTADLSHVDDDGGVARLEKAFLPGHGGGRYFQTDARRAACMTGKRRSRRASLRRPTARSCRQRMKPLRR
jgi:acyl-CoA dehydrogenase